MATTAQIEVLVKANAELASAGLPTCSDLIGALHELIVAAEKSGQPLGEWAATPFANARVVLDRINA